MLDNLTTEGRNPASESIDSLSAREIVQVMNAEDGRVAEAVGSAADAIAQAIEVIADRLRHGGRLLYMGAGTSGRLGVLDASECPPTFNTPPELVVGLIAGGYGALTRSIEGAEDFPERADEDLQAVGLTGKDVLVGIATSGRTPYVVRGLEFARRHGAVAIGLACNADSQLATRSDITITVVVGPEVISGSTRLKAGTATKMVLNILTTGAMVLLGKTYGNLMVDLRATNEKLTVRTKRIVTMLTDLPASEAERLLTQCDGELKTAVVAQRRGVSPAEARVLLTRAGGHLRRALDESAEPSATTASSLQRSPGQADTRDGSARDGHDDDLVLGIDGGGSKTVAWLARRTESAVERVGEGHSGASNPQAVGYAAMASSLDRAIDSAFQSAGIAPQQVAAACVALAGSDRDDVRLELDRWANRRALAGKTQWIHDGLATLWAGTPDGRGVALIAGTGSFAFGQNDSGQTSRCGGWGYLFGDEGSGYAMALSGLRAVTKATDGRGPQTSLRDRLLQRLKLDNPHELITAVYQSHSDRTSIAKLAEVVIDCAQVGDEIAGDIVQAAGAELAGMVRALAHELGFDGAPLPLVLGGSLLLNSPILQDALQSELTDNGLAISEITRVPDPVAGAVKLAHSATR